MAGKLSTISSTSLGAERVRLEDDKRSKGKEKKINVLVTFKKLMNTRSLYALRTKRHTKMFNYISLIR